MSILSHRLVRVIETNADALVHALHEKIAASPRCAEYHRVPGEELGDLVGGVYAHLGQWLLTRPEAELEQRYSRIGARRAEQGVPVSQLLWCIILVKENLWEFLRKNDALENTSQIWGELELMEMVEQFFDRALYFAAHGHEMAIAAQKAGKKD